MDKVTVRICNPAKVGAAVLMPGVHEVEPGIAEELAAAGLLAPEGEIFAEADPSASPVASAEAIDRMVAERAEVIARTIVEAAVEQALTEITGERDVAIARAEAAEAKLADLESGAREAAPGGEKRPAATAAKAPKKGAAATKG